MAKKFNVKRSMRNLKKLLPDLDAEKLKIDFLAKLIDPDKGFYMASDTANDLTGIVVAVHTYKKKSSKKKTQYVGTVISKGRPHCFTRKCVDAAFHAFVMNYYSPILFIEHWFPTQILADAVIDKQWLGESMTGTSKADEPKEIKPFDYKNSGVVDLQSICQMPINLHMASGPVSIRQTPINFGEVESLSITGPERKPVKYGEITSMSISRGVDNPPEYESTTFMKETKTPNDTGGEDICIHINGPEPAPSAEAIANVGEASADGGAEHYQ